MTTNPIGQHRDQAEERGHLPGGPVGGLLVDVGQPGQVLLAGPGPGPGSGGRRRRRQLGGPSLLGRHRCGRSESVISPSLPWPRSRSAKNIRMPRPRIQAHRPSLTGPSPPSASPPSVGLLVQLVEVADDGPLVLGGQHLVGEHRHLLRAGEHGLVQVLVADARTAPARTCRPAARRRHPRSCGRPSSWSGTARRRGRCSSSLRPGRVVLLRLGDRRAGAERGHVRGQRERPPPRCRLVLFTGACAPGVAIGIRPVATWNSTAAAPDADQRRALDGAGDLTLAVQTVAGGARRPRTAPCPPRPAGWCRCRRPTFVPARPPRTARP